MNMKSIKKNKKDQFSRENPKRRREEEGKIRRKEEEEEETRSES